MGTDSTLTNEIYNELYRAITHQELKPGQNLTLTMLKKQFNVSHTPIREVLTASTPMDWLPTIPIKA